MTDIYYTLVFGILLVSLHITTHRAYPYLKENTSSHKFPFRFVLQERWLSDLTNMVVIAGRQNPPMAAPMSILF